MPLVARAAHAATAAYQRAMTSKRERLYQQENQRLRQENAWLRNEVRHCWDAIDVMDRLAGMASEFPDRSVGRTVVVDQRRLLEVHLREQLAAELEDALLQGFETGYKAGLTDGRPPGAQRRRLTGDS
ncbi:hypothetical protein [Salinispora sp. H7-4]|uniref:hypothetical protein n=1 Tax=Salinispora sp. H7-4 TaxID=2748321 RepID=UPI0015D23232|nr:hypothetical protein [Salinispora sp. H7-4]NYT96344.1 hypothetical protein [Salinispora sp. H7-4]